LLPGGTFFLTPGSWKLTKI
jgi:hypothetical protein